MTNPLTDRLQREAIDKYNRHPVKQRIHAIESIAHVHGAGNYEGPYLSDLLDNIVEHTIKETLTAVEEMVKTKKDAYMAPLTEQRFLRDLTTLTSSSETQA